MLRAAIARSGATDDRFRAGSESPHAGRLPLNRHALVWALAEPGGLSARARTAVSNPASDVYVRDSAFSRCTITRIACLPVQDSAQRATRSASPASPSGVSRKLRDPGDPHHRENTVPCGAAVPTNPCGHVLPDKLIPGRALPGSRKRSSSDSRPFAGSKLMRNSRLLAP